MKNGLITLIALLHLVCSALTYASDTPPHRLLIVDSQHGNPYDEIRRALLQELAEEGYVEGDNLQVTLKAIGNHIALGEKMLRREVKNGYDVVFVGGTSATIAAKQALFGTEQAVVFGAPTDPVGIGVIDNFSSSPSANFTGVSYPVPVKARLRFIRQILPEAHTLGLIYADMPQSHSYKNWLETLLAKEREFRDIQIIFREVPLVTGESGSREMARMAQQYIRELNGMVDAFISPNDQMGTQKWFAKEVYAMASKPLIGLVRNDVMAGHGATAVIYPSHESIGRQAAKMIAKLFSGMSVQAIHPQWPTTYGYAVDLPKVRQFSLKVPVGILQLAGRDIVKK